MNELSVILGNERRKDLLREAEASRRLDQALRESHPGRSSLRRRIGHALVRAGHVLAGPDAIQPANGH